MRILAIPIIFLGYILTIASCEPSYSQGVSSNGGNSLVSDDPANDEIDKRAERYAFGLGRRGYTYTSGGSGVKRLPVYNFGLGKRTRPYAFGLGKRSDDDEYAEPSDLAYDGWNGAGTIGKRSRDNDGADKRARPYSFGLGKRLPMLEDSSVERRGSRYNFGLGRR